MNKLETKRLEMIIPKILLELVDEYKEKEAIKTRTAAILELIRKGLKEK